MADAEPPEHRAEGAFEERWSAENWVLIGAFLSLSVVGVAISTGQLTPGVVRISDEYPADSVHVPLFVYLYASLGALGYIFTKLMTNLEEFVEWGDLEELVKMGLRIPAAWVLAAGVYLLFVPMTPETVPESPRLAAGVAFLVGLYVNVTVKSLGGLADRLLGRR